MNIIKIKTLTPYTLIICFLLIFLNSCSNINSSSLGSNVDLYTRAYMDANITVKERISGTANRSYFLGFIPITIGKTYSISNVWPNWEPKTVFEAFSGIDPIVSEATYYAIKNSSSDIIVEPRYEIVINNYIFWTEKICTVTGFKGMITDFKNIPTTDNSKIEYLNK